MISRITPTPAPMHTGFFTDTHTPLGVWEDSGLQWREKLALLSREGGAKGGAGR